MSGGGSTGIPVGDSLGQVIACRKRYNFSECLKVGRVEECWME